HFDAHTDLLKSRMGIDYCFGTWAYHANDLIGRSQRLVQVGIRKSGKTKEHWEKTLQVKQFWAKDILKNPKRAEAQILDHLHSLKLNKVYISNDIDGTGMEYAAATGTAEPHGLTPKFVSNLIQKVGEEFEVIGGDLVEVAPPLHLDHKGEPKKTLDVGTHYILHTLQMML
ncbi:MAG: arginase family protein, partial [Deltaproteobacteria bacterium]|nr:arginase family protein [Deltaproteobacteria bacterium]